MRKFILAFLLLGALNVYGQDTIPAQPKIDRESGFELKDNVSIFKSGIIYGSKTYTDIYDVVTDSIVHRFGLEFKYDSTFVRRVPMQDVNRKLYDVMNTTTIKALSEQDSMQKETIDFLNRYKTSVEIWTLFKMYELLK